MSTFEIKMPKLGESITEGTIVSWSVKVGDAVQEDDVLFDSVANIDGPGDNRTIRDELAQIWQFYIKC